MKISILAAVLTIIAAAGVAEPVPDFCGVYLHPGEFADAALSVEQREARMDEALDKVRDCGFTALIPYANTSSGGAYWPSKHLPMAGAPDYDALGILAKKARARGLRLMPAVCVLVSGDKEPAGVLLSHPEWAVQGPDGKPLGYINPENREARAWIVAMLCEMAEHVEVDGIMLDYLRFPNRKDVQLPASDGTDALPLQQRKEAALSALMAEISAAVNRLHPGIKLGLYTWGPHVTENHPVAQRWPDWVRDGHLDLLNVSGYCYTDNYGDSYMQAFEDRLRGAAELARNAGDKVAMTFALGVRTSHGAIKSASEIRDYLAVAKRAGCPGVAAFAWRSVEPYAAEIKAERYFTE